MTQRETTCVLCGGGLEAIAGVAALRRVTSDCRPWDGPGEIAVCDACGMAQRPRNQAWARDCAAIYADYTAYRQGRGAEQRIATDNAGLGLARSKVFLQQILAHMGAPPGGRLLDVGCGGGHLLRTMAGLAPGWRLTGTDLSDARRAEIEAIPGVETYHAGNAADAPGRFDLITAVHVVEHFPDPVRALSALTAKAAPGGLLAVEVPDLAANPFDLLIADHGVMHTADSLRRTAAAAGWRVVALRNDWIPKELTLLACPGNDPAAPRPDGSGPAETRRLVSGWITWLTALRDQALAAATARGRALIVGTSIAGAWMASELGPLAVGFIDEDENRIGGTHLGAPILSPAMIPPGELVIAPLVPAVAAAVCGRLAARGVDIVRPQPWPCAAE